MVYGFLGPWEFAVIAGIVVLLFGASRLPKLSRSVGKSIREFKEGVGGQDENKSEENVDKIEGKESEEKEDQK
jgi:sec-independent protein translocase protein TatA